MADRPNVLLLVADQHHHAMLGQPNDPATQGTAPAITPVQDALAAEGVRFVNHYTQNPICTPSRICFHSGQYPHNHGYYSLTGPTPTFPSFMHHFKAAGYRTAAIGKNHLPDNPRHWLADCCDLLADTIRGTDGVRAHSHFRDYMRRVGTIDFDDHNQLREMGNHPHHWDARPSKVPLEHCVEAWITDTARGFLEGLGEDQPFCMQLAYPRPHHVLTPDQRFWDMYPADLEPPATLHDDCAHRPPNFQAMVQYCREELPWCVEPKDFDEAARRVWRGTLALATQNDYFFGKLIEYLRETRRFDNTIIVTTADHGLYHGHYGIMEKAPGICSDAIGRVPSIWRGPGIERGATREHLIEHVDLPPTLCALAGLEPMTTCDGISLAPALADGAAKTKEVAVTECPWSKAIRWKNYRFVHYHRRMYEGEDIGELYDLAADPLERTNLYHDPAHQGTVTEMRRRLLEWITETTRITTMWPDLQEDKAAFAKQEPHQMDPDGREPNTKGPAARLAHGQFGSFVARDYL